MGTRPGTLGESLARRRRFVGRSAELELVRAALAADEPPFQILFLHGPGGIGKSAMLHEVGDLCATHRAHVVRLDLRDLDPSPTAVLAEYDEGVAAAGDRRVVVLLDTAEVAAVLDTWLRTRFVPGLPSDALLVVAGRDAPSVGWRSDPALSGMVRSVALRNLQVDETLAYLRERRVSEGLHARVVEVTHGHPLGMCLLTDLLLDGMDPEADLLSPDLVGTLLRQFVDEVPSALHRRALEVCAVARVTDESLLRDVLHLDDAHDLFAWLRAQSFLLSHPGGLMPHDLARDALRLDLRWRDRESYRATRRAVGLHFIDHIGTLTGRAQQRALFESQFLLRGIPAMAGMFEHRDQASQYLDSYTSGDRDAVLDAVERWEGPESRRIAAAWLDRQPEYWHIGRDEKGRMRGIVGFVDVNRPDALADGRDPVADAARAWVAGHTPAEPGEPVLLMRFTLDVDHYQSPSGFSHLPGIVSVRNWVLTPRLAWAFSVVQEPEKFDEYFRFLRQPRCVGADTVVGGHRFGLFGLDVKRLPADHWLARVHGRRAGTTLPATPGSLPAEAFRAAVRQALKDLRPDQLGTNPLSGSRVVAAAGGDPATALRAWLVAAIDRLKDDPRDEKLHHALDRTFVRPAMTQEKAAEVLGLPFSTYRRHLTRGIERLVAMLRDDEARAG